MGLRIASALDANILTRRSAAVANKFALSAFMQQPKISVKTLKNFRFTSI
jgi:hypothetical protein